MQKIFHMPLKNFWEMAIIALEDTFLALFAYLFISQKLFSASIHYSGKHFEWLLQLHQFFPEIIFPWMRND